MKKIKKFLTITFITIIMLLSNVGFSQPEPGGGDCIDAAPICTDYSYNFPLQTGTDAEMPASVCIDCD